MNSLKKKNKKGMPKDDEYTEEVDQDDENNDTDDEEEDCNESGSENATDYEDEYILSATNGSLMEEIVDILRNKSDINCPNALALNKQMQKNLINVRDSIAKLLERIKNRLAFNEKNLMLVKKYKQKGVGIRGAYLKGGTFYLKGNMFFKDVSCRSCPNNSDYIHRSEIEREMFPMDFELRGRHVWSMRDKYDIVQGIKEQVIDHLSPITSKRTKQDQLDKKIALHTEKLTNLLEKVDANFRIDWKLISIYNLKHRHSPSSSKAMWNVYLMPELKRCSWTNDENKKLLEAAKRHNYEDWKSIAAEVSHRSDYQCFVHFQTKLHKLIKRESKWTASDDKRLLEIVNACTVNGVINWNAVCVRFPDRSKNRCCVRYYYTVNPVLSHAPFTAEEDLILLAAVEEYGENFACMPRTLFPNRSTLQLRNRYKNTLCHRDKNNGWTHEEDKKLMDFVAEHGESSWKKCADAIGTHTRTSCRGRFTTITKFFKKNPEGKLEDLVSRPRAKDNCISLNNWTEKIVEIRNNPDAWKSKSLDKRKIKSEMKHKLVKPEKPEKSEKSDKSKQKYITRLRTNELELYNAFKYAYNFKLLTDPCCTIFTRPFSLAVVQNACGFQISSYQRVKADETLPSNVAMSCSNMLSIATTHHGLDQHMADLWGYRLPPNWSTLMGFRALCVQSNQTAESKTKTEDTTVVENSQAVKLFRQRLRVILYTTALLSRLNPQNVNNLKQRMEYHPMSKPLSQTERSILPYEISDLEQMNFCVDNSVATSQKQIGIESNEQDNPVLCTENNSSLSHTQIDTNSKVKESYELCEQKHNENGIDFKVPFRPCKKEQTIMCEGAGVQSNDMKKVTRKRILCKRDLNNKKSKYMKIQEGQIVQNCSADKIKIELE